MAKQPKKEKVKARVLKRRLRNMVQLQHFDPEDRFIVLVQVSEKYKFWMTFEKFEEIFDDFKAIVKAKKRVKPKKDGK